ncbi:hypothetical protein ACWDV4_19370 [Micromonospora sp. NPDC003197]
MRALEDLQAAVRDPGSRRYLTEAVRAYQAGAFRPAIVGIWVAVALDLVNKIREIAASGEGEARSFVEGLDRAVISGNVEHVAKLERDLLEVCRDKFELLIDREVDELERLRRDRHVCAHPAFVRPDEVFEPTPELVRVHLGTAVDAVLSKGPTPGKKAIERFRHEIDGTAFPNNLDDLCEYLRERYFERGKSSLRRGLAELIVKVAINPPDGDLRRGDRCALAAHALERIQPELLSHALNKVVKNKEEGLGLTATELIRFAGALGDLDLAWLALPASSHSRVRAAVEAADLGSLLDHGLFTRQLPEGIAAVVNSRREHLNVGNLMDVVTQNPELSFTQAAIKVFADSGSFRAAEANMARLILPIAKEMSASDIKSIIAIFVHNNQIHFASGMPDLMLKFFHSTVGHFTECATDWYTLSAAMQSFDQAGGYYSYPDLREAIDSEPPF